MTLATVDQGEVNVAPLLGVSFPRFDLILDLGAPPLLALDIPPLGYCAPGGDPVKLEQTLAELPAMVGEFEKPQFFHYDPAICAHGHSGLKGCTRCLAVCPTGAIRYGYPAPADTLNRLRVLLRVYREQGGEDPSVLFYDAEGEGSARDWPGRRLLETLGQGLGRGL